MILANSLHTKAGKFIRVFPSHLRPIRYLVIVILSAGLCSCSDDGNTLHPESINRFDNATGTARLRVQPSDTSAAVLQEAHASDYHYVASPANTNERKNILLLYLAGSGISPNEAIDISDFAADLGLNVINLRYMNFSGDGNPATDTIGVACLGKDDCFAQHRGETVFGEGVVYADGLNSYDHDGRAVDAENSVVGRIVSLLDYLAHQSPSADNPNPGFWKQFLLRDDRSPYVTPHLGNVYPDWSKIIIAGHSQGGGQAAMLAMNVSPENPLLQVIMFSSPNDFKGNTGPASWITQTSATPMDRFWGLAHQRDIPLGMFSLRNWDVMGGPNSGGVGGPDNNQPVKIGNGSGDPMGAQRLVLNSIVLDIPFGQHAITVDGSKPAIRQAWNYLFTANGQH